MPSRSVAPLAALAAAVLTACTATPTWPPADTVFIGPEPREVRRADLHRYMCANGAPLLCRCASLGLGDCICGC